MEPPAQHSLVSLFDRAAIVILIYNLEISSLPKRLQDYITTFDPELTIEEALILIRK